MPFGMGGGPGWGGGPGGPGGPYGGPGMYGRRRFGFGFRPRPPMPPGGPWGRPPRRGCYIATAVYGSYDCPQVWVLRRYRDQVLDQSLPGKIFIKVYYALSPTFVKLFGGNRTIMAPFRNYLDRKVEKLEKDGFADTPYQDVY